MKPLLRVKREKKIKGLGVWQHFKEQPGCFNPFLLHRVTLFK